MKHPPDPPGVLPVIEPEEFLGCIGATLVAALVFLPYLAIILYFILATLRGVSVPELFAPSISEAPAEW